MNSLTRRDWVLAAACWTEILRGQEPVRRFAFFDARTAAEVESIAETILPADDTPGARDAGVIWFIDRALAGHDEDQRATYRKGLADLEARRDRMFSQSPSIAGLTPAERITLLTSIEDTEFFRLVRLHTILGFFGHPKHGGNRGFASAKLLRMETSMHFEPPFGYYDREADR